MRRAEGGRDARMGWIGAYRRRWRRRLLLWRAIAGGRALRPLADRTAAIRPGAVLCVCVIRDEAARLPAFLRHYRALGVGHFLFVDNASTDGSADWLAAQPDVSVWRAAGSYARARFGMDWAMALLRRHAHGHWALTVDADEFLVYPHCDSRPLPALTDWLDRGGLRSFPAMLLDVYPRGPLDAVACPPGADPIAAAPWFDAANYTFRRDPEYRNLWIQGGPRARAFFADRPEAAPALNKIPLVRWHRRVAYVHSTHMLLPRGLNLTYDTRAGERPSGALLHAKFVHAARPPQAVARLAGEHWAQGREFAAVRAGIDGGATLWTRVSTRYRDWRQLEELGLISAGDWA